MTYFQAYVLTRLDGLLDLFSTFEVISGIFLVLCGFFCFVSVIAESDWEGFKPGRKKAIYIAKCLIGCFIICSFLKALTPTTKEAAFIYIAPAIVNNQDIQKTIKKVPELSGLGLEYLGEVLRQEIKDAKKEVKESVEGKF